MKEVYREAFSEIEQIIKLMPETLSNKIPTRFKNIIYTEKSKTYFPKIQEPFEDCKIMEETSIILAIIYRDFICNQEERNNLKIRDAEKLRVYEEELKEKYNPDNLFKNKRTYTPDNNISSQETALIEVKEKNFIQKLFEKIKHLFKRS